MTFAALIRRNLTYHWRPNLAVLLGVATAVAVLGGALLVGESVRNSLRRLALERIGNAHTVVTSSTLFREELTTAWRDAAPLIALEGLVTHQPSGKRATALQVYGVDSRFWRFHQLPELPLAARQAAISAPLAEELAAQPGDTLLLRLEKPADVPAESLFGRKDDPASTIRLQLSTILPASRLGEFSLRPTQAAVRALFVPLPLLQREINAPGRVNTILLARSAASAPQTLRAAFQLEDLGVRLRLLEDRDALHLDTLSGIIPDSLAAAALDAARAANLETRTLFTYLATRLQLGQRHIPYSLVAATDLHAFLDNPTPDSIVLNDWAARDLGAKPGDTLTLHYLLWHPDNRITEESAPFQLAAVTPIRGLAADRDLAPDYPGITDAYNVADWDPPFPMNLKLIRPKDEDFWDAYRATPKAFLPLERAQQLWGSRWGKLTTIRLRIPDAHQPEALEHARFGFRARLRAKLDPLDHGFTVLPLRDLSLAAARGATDFGEYFTYFSFFLMLSALLLAGLFFRLGLEQRFAEVGLLQALGFPPHLLRRIFFAEGVVLSFAGGVLGVAGAVAYAALVLTGLTTVWVDAVGTRQLGLSLAATPMLTGFAAGLLASLAAVFLTLRGIQTISPRGLLAAGAAAQRRSRAQSIAVAAGAAALLLVVASFLQAVPAAAGFFGAGALSLIGLLAWLRLRLTLPSPVHAIPSLALRNAAYRPGRTVLSAALIASATFLIVSVESFRRNPYNALDKKSGTGGYALFGESVRPLYYNPETPQGRENFPNLPPQTHIAGFRLRPGDDASCLNLYQPRNPRILGVSRAFARQARFSFASALQSVDNPWMLLFEPPRDGAFPAIADANSITYVLHKKLGDIVEFPDGKRLRLVAALADSIFQSELIVGDDTFQLLFPREQGFRVFLVETPNPDATIEQLESALSDHGLDLTLTAAKLASFHRVENTYLSTFQTLGALGLLLGTVGLGAVLFRNVLERRRELALLEALGFTPQTLTRLILLENLVLLLAGIAIGVAASLLAIAPVLLARGSQASLLAITAWLAAVLATGLSAAFLATRAALRLRLLDSLRAS